MRQIKVNLLAGERHRLLADGTGPRPVSFFLSTFLVLAAFTGSFGFGRLTNSEAAAMAVGELEGIPILGQMKHLIGSPDRKLAGEADDRINILLLGMGGAGHEGPNLTDTIMVASIKPSTSQVTLLSIPRDLIVPLQGSGWQKINSVNAFAELKTPGHGGDVTRTMLEGLLGLDIPYYVRVDFEGFKDVVEAVDGIEVHVDRGFTDPTYPTKNYGVTTVTFAEGWQEMDGDTALRFARSRHGNNGEGSDFARAQRQQKVLNALKDKALDGKAFRSPTAIVGMVSALGRNVTTNLQIGELLRFARLAQSADYQIARRVIDNGPDSPLTDGSYGGAYVLVPRDDDWGGLRRVAADVFAEAVPEPDAGPKPDAAAIAEGRAKVEIRNGSGRVGQARVAAGDLTNAGFEVVKIGNADSFAYEETIIYDLTKGEKPASLARLKQAMADAEASTRLPKTLEAGALDADFLVILGGPADSASAGSNGT